MNEHFINRFLLTDRQSAIALSDTSLHVAFLAYGSLNAREYIVNLNGVAVSSVCYYTSVSNECSSFWSVFGDVFQREMCYAYRRERGFYADSRRETFYRRAIRGCSA